MSIRLKVLLSCLPLIFILSCGGGGGGGGGDDLGSGPGPNPGDVLNPGLAGRFFLGAWIMDADTGEYTLTPNTDWPKQTDRFNDAGVKLFGGVPIEHNGSEFLVVANGNLDSSVALQDYNGNYLAQINLPDNIYGGVVSQDLQHVAIFREGTPSTDWLEIYNWAGTLIDDVKLTRRSLFWLRDNRILYSGGRSLYITKPLSAENDEALTMTLPEPGGDIQAGGIGDKAISPDETRIAFVIVSRDEEGNVLHSRLYMVNINGTGLRRVATVYGDPETKAAINNVQWSPDGRWLYVINGYIPDHDTSLGLTFFPNMYLVPTEDMGKVFYLSTNAAERSPEVRLFYRNLSLPKEHGGKTNKATMGVFWIPDQ